MRRIDLAERLRLTPSGVTRLLDGLEEAGLTGRRDCPSDARVTYSVLTDAGREMLRHASCTHAAVCEELIGSHLSPAELEELSACSGGYPAVTRSTHEPAPAADAGDQEPEAAGFSLSPERREPLLELARLHRREIPERRANVRANRHPVSGDDALHRRLPRESLDRCPELREPVRPGGRRLPDDSCHRLGEGRRERRHGADRATLDPPEDQGLRPDEDIEPQREIRLEHLPGCVADLQAGEVRGELAKQAKDVQRHGIPARLRKLVDVEGQGGAGARGGDEVRELCRPVEHEIRRPDHRHGRRARFPGVGGERDRIRRGLRAAMGRDVETPGCGLDEETKPPLSLVDREEHAFPVRPEGEHAVEVRSDIVREERFERLVVEVAPARQKRRYRSGEDPVEQGVVRHTLTLDSRDMDALRIEREGDILRVTLARPESRNAFDATLIEELAEAFVDVGKARAVVLAGEGRSFCAGADIEWMRSSAGLTHAENVADANALRRMFDAIDTCPAPVIALVQGHALGGGAGLVATADIAIAQERAVFAFSEVKLGIIPAVISPYALGKIGESAARRYFVTGERFDAATALRIGLVHEVAADLEPALSSIVDELRTAGPRAARYAKRLVLDRPDGPETARRIAERRTSAEGQEGLRAFVERERPPWAPPVRDQ